VYEEIAVNIEPIIMAAEVQETASEASNQHRQDIASYIADMLMEMRTMAEGIQLGKAVKSIDAAYYDVYAAAGGAIHTKGRPPRG
jgi:hypothetical protein